MSEADTQVGRYTIDKSLHKGKALIRLGHSPMGDTVVLKSGPKTGIETEKACLLQLKDRDASCEHFIRLLDFVESPSDGVSHQDAGQEEEDDFEVVEGGMGVVRLEAHLVLETADGSMESWLRSRNHRPNWAEVLDVGHSLGKALEWIHKQGLVHSDVKPSNVLKFQGNTWKLSDFGSATEDGSPCHELTTAYCAPEQALAFVSGQAVVASKDADVWAYAKILYEIGCGDASALVSNDTNRTSKTSTVSEVARLGGNLVDEGKLRFPVLRSVLRASLKETTPRLPMEKIMQRGFWTGNATISLEITESSQQGGPRQESNPAGKKKQKAVLELLETEKEYCARLQSVVVDVINPMREAWKRGEIPIEETQLQVFTDLETLHRSNEFFKQQLHKRVETEGNIGVGEIMNEFARTLLRNYEHYISRFFAASECLHKEKRRSREFKQYLEVKIGEGQQSIDDYLILPVQRLPRYKLLLERIVIYTPDSTSEEFRKLQEALAAVSDTCDAINESTSVMRSPQPRSNMSFASWSEDGGGQGFRTTTVICGTAVVVLGLVVLVRERNLAHSHETARLGAELERLRAQNAQAMAKVAEAAAAKSRETSKMVVVSTAGAVALTALFFSDVRLKTRVRKVRRSGSGLNVYQYSYLWEPEIMWQGVMAQDLQNSHEVVHRGAVHQLPSGYLIVDYSQLDVSPVCMGRIPRQRHLA